MRETNFLAATVSWPSNLAPSSRRSTGIRREHGMPRIEVKWLALEELP